jgi:hypothetical protein
MRTILDKIAINVHARRILLTILEENPYLSGFSEVQKMKNRPWMQLKTGYIPFYFKTRPPKLIITGKKQARII